MLARIIEIVSGKSLDKCLSERVLEPMGMHDTMWAVPKAKSHRLSALYGGPKHYKVLYSKASKHSLLHGPGRRPYAEMVHNGKGLVEIERGGADSMFIEGRACPIFAGGGYMGYDAGGLVSTVADFAKMVKMLFNFGLADNGRRILLEDTVQAMEVDKLDRSAQKKWDYSASGICFMGNIGSFCEGSGEIGMGGAANTYWNIDREAGTASVWFAQHLDFPEFYDLKSVNPKHADLWNLLRNARLPESMSSNRKNHSAPLSKSKKASPSKRG